VQRRLPGDLPHVAPNPWASVPVNGNARDRRPAVSIRPVKSFQLDRHWRRSLLFTLILVGLVIAGIGGDGTFELAALATCGVGFGFFYLVFAGGMHFGITVANLLAIYACMFVFFRDANFPDARETPSIVAWALPVAGFLGSCFLRRPEVAGAIRARRIRELEHLPRLTRWVPGTLAVGAISFALPRLALTPSEQGAALVVSMAVITAFVVAAVRDVVLLQMDVAIIFESVAERLNRLLMPVVAFLTLYSLLVVVFACLYRIAEFSSGIPQFSVHGKADVVTFSDALYFSVATISTVGYGDISPATPLARGLAGLEVVSGLLMLLFGFSEIMRNAGPDTVRRGSPVSPPVEGQEQVHDSD
jgi:voltage-gated potassium channel